QPFLIDINSATPLFPAIPSCDSLSVVKKDGGTIVCICRPTRSGKVMILTQILAVHQFIVQIGGRTEILIGTHQSLSDKVPEIRCRQEIWLTINHLSL